MNVTITTWQMGMNGFSNTVCSNFVQIK
ncbi:uncharacterized protein METZ01_LOCUS162927, partial [marine metagenome]